MDYSGIKNSVVVTCFPKSPIFFLFFFQVQFALPNYFQRAKYSALSTYQDVTSGKLIWKCLSQELSG